MSVSKPTIKYSTWVAEIARVTSKERKLDLLTKTRERLGAILRLKYQIDKIEIMAKPNNMSGDEWYGLTRSKKWKKILNNVSEDFILRNLVLTIQQMFGDPTEFVKRLVLLYSKVEVSLHDYIMDKFYIPKKTYKEIFTNNLVPLLNSVTVNVC